MNAIAISNVAIRQTENNLYNLNDLHKASGGEKRHELTNWLKLQQTTELIDELSKPEIPGLEENQQVIQVVKGGNKRGTYACKELVYAYATWISAKFFLLVIRTFDAVVSGSLQPKLAQTTVADRTPLRQAVSALVGKCNIDYSSAYSMVHQRFGVESIEEIAADKLPDAIAYIHALTLHSGLFGEVLEKQPASQGVVLTERQMGHFAAGAYMLDLATRRLADLSEPLKMLGARDKGVSAWTIRDESEIWIKNCRSALEAVLPQMGDNFYRGSVQESLRMMDALAAR